MDGRSTLADSLRATITQLEQARKRAMQEGRLSDALTIGGMAESTRYSLGLLTDRFYGQPPRKRLIRGGREPLSERHETLLRMTMDVLSKEEQELLWLTVGHDVTLEAAAVALNLPLAGAQALEDSMVDKLRTVQRNVRAGGNGDAHTSKDTLPVPPVC